jgi:hypothetical protein
LIYKKCAIKTVWGVWNKIQEDVFLAGILIKKFLKSINFRMEFWRFWNLRAIVFVKRGIFRRARKIGVAQSVVLGV